jgi:predicted enzyme related to lactoylglutathione lyase
MLLEQLLERGPGRGDAGALQRFQGHAAFGPRPMRREQQLQVRRCLLTLHRCDWCDELVAFAVAASYEHEGNVAVVAAGDCRLVLNQDDGKLGWDRKKGQGFYLQINVAGPADVDATAARITAAGGKLIDEPADRPWGARIFHFHDLDGFKLGVSTPLAG